MRFSDKIKYKYLQGNYGKKRRRKKPLNIIKNIDGIEDYLERKLGKHTSPRR